MITEPSLFPPDTADPADYPPVKNHRLDREAHTGDIAKFVVEYIIADKMGLIATQHLIIGEVRHSQISLANSTRYL